MITGKRLPALAPGFPGGSGNKFFSEGHGRVMAGGFVTPANFLAFSICQQREVDGLWNGASGKLRGSAQVDVKPKKGGS